jgi:hypothetical protein
VVATLPDWWSSRLQDASSRSIRCRNKLGEQDVERIIALRQKRLTGDAISFETGFCRSSVFRVLRKAGCSRLRALKVKEKSARYQWEKPSQMLHIDIKKLGKIDGVGHRVLGRQQAKQQRAGWEYLHVCVDDASRIAYTVRPE